MTAAELLVLIKKFRSEVEDLVNTLVNRYYFNRGVTYDDEETVCVEDGVPYTSEADVLARVPVAQRKPFFPTVNINGVEYWFDANLDLVPKFADLTIPDGSITLVKMADMATASVIYRKSAGTGVWEVQSLATLRADLNIPAAVNLDDYVLKITNYSLVANSSIALIHAPGSDNQTLDDLLGVLRPTSSTTHGIAIFTDDTGEEIESTSHTIDHQGQVVFVATPVAEYAVGLDVSATGDDSYGVSAKAEKIPILGCTLDVAAATQKTGMAIRGDSASMDGASVGYGLKYTSYIPVQGWVDPADSEREAGFISFVIAESTAGAESVDIEFWSLREGVMTKQGTLNHHGVFSTMGTYRDVLSTYYSSTLGGELQITINDLIGAEIIQVIRNIQPLKTGEYTFDTALGKITIAEPLSVGETLYITYKKLAG